jgi:hypothetical protein
VYLKRHSAALGAQLALVTKDSDVRHYAEMLDIPIYTNIHKAEESHWRRPRRRKRGKASRKRVFSTIRSTSSHQLGLHSLDELRQLAHPDPAPWLVHPITRLVLFTLGVLGVLAIAAVLVPSAEIQVTPKTQLESISIPVAASLDIESVNLSGMVPAQPISVIVEGRGKIISTSSISIPDQNAQGNVVFTNLTDQEISVPMGTFVSTVGESAIRFATLQAVEVIPESESDLIPIEAVLPGKFGNVLSNQIIGSDRISPAPSEIDYQILEEEMLKDLHQTALEELASILGQNDLLLQANPNDFKIIEETYTPIEIQPADQLRLTLRVEYQAYFASGDQLRELGQSVLLANLPEHFSPIPYTLEIEIKNKPTLAEDGSFSWDIQAKWEVGAAFDEVDAITIVLWQTPEVATRKLAEALPIDQNLMITMTPNWWPRLPILPFRVTVTYIN